MSCGYQAATVDDGEADRRHLQMSWEGRRRIPQRPGLYTNAFRGTGNIPFPKCHLLERSRKFEELKFYKEEMNTRTGKNPRC